MLEPVVFLSPVFESKSSVVARCATSTSSALLLLLSRSPARGRLGDDLGWAKEGEAVRGGRGGGHVGFMSVPRAAPRGSPYNGHRCSSWGHRQTKREFWGTGPGFLTPCMFFYRQMQDGLQAGHDHNNDELAVTNAQSE